jgi:hypothetical protein
MGSTVCIANRRLLQTRNSQMLHPVAGKAGHVVASMWSRVCSSKVIQTDIFGSSTCLSVKRQPLRRSEKIQSILAMASSTNRD